MKLCKHATDVPSIARTKERERFVFVSYFKTSTNVWVYAAWRDVACECVCVCVFCPRSYLWHFYRAPLSLCAELKDNYYRTLLQWILHWLVCKFIGIVGDTGICCRGLCSAREICRAQNPPLFVESGCRNYVTLLYMWVTCKSRQHDCVISSPLIHTLRDIQSILFPTQHECFTVAQLNCQ